MESTERVAAKVHMPPWIFLSTPNNHSGVSLSKYMTWGTMCMWSRHWKMRRRHRGRWKHLKGNPQHHELSQYEERTSQCERQSFQCEDRKSQCEGRKSQCEYRDSQFEKTQCETRNIQRRALWFEKRCALRVEQDATDTVPQKYVWSTPLQFHHPTPQMDRTGEYNFTSRRKPTVARRAGLTAPLVKPKPWRQRHLNVRSHHTTQKN